MQCADHDNSVDGHQVILTDKELTLFRAFEELSDDAQDCIIKSAINLRIKEGDAHNEAIAYLHKFGRNPDEIASELHVSKNKVIKVLLDIESRKKTRESIRRKQEVKCQKGGNINSIADTAYFPVEEVLKILKKRREKPIKPIIAGEPFTDLRDGQTYRTVKIGDQVWMAENFRYKTDDSWCYNDSESLSNRYGRLYTWDIAALASPAGWHLPNIAEWRVLIAYVGGKEVAGKRLKAKLGWSKPDGTDVSNADDYGFSVLPAGYRTPNGSFHGFDDCCFLWTIVDEEIERICHKDPIEAWRISRKDDIYMMYDSKYSGHSVRYIADEPC